MPPWMASASSFAGDVLMCEGLLETGLAPSYSAPGDAAHRVSTGKFSGRSIRPTLGRSRKLLRGAGLRRYQFFQFPPRQPAFIVVARISETFRKRLGVHPIFRLPPRMRRLNHVHVLRFKRLP